MYNILKLYLSTTIQQKNQNLCLFEMATWHDTENLILHGLILMQSLCCRDNNNSDRRVSHGHVLWRGSVAHQSPAHWRNERGESEDGPDRPHCGVRSGWHSRLHSRRSVLLVQSVTFYLRILYLHILPTHFTYMFCLPTCWFNTTYLLNMSYWLLW